MGLAVDRNGTVYVGNRNLAAHEVFVNEYAAGGSSPTLTITFPEHNLPEIGGIAVDGALNLYVLTSFSGGASIVTKFAPGSTQGTDLGLHGLGDRADGVGIDGAGTLYVTNSLGDIDVFPAGSTSPKRQIRSGLLSPAFFTVDASGALFVPNQSPQRDAGNVLEFAPGARRAKFTTDGFDYPTGTGIRPS